MMKHAARTYREHGLWGAAVRTCSGPEDRPILALALEVKIQGESECRNLHRRAY